VRLIAALLAAASLALLNFALLAGAGYARFATEHLGRPAATSTLAAAQLAHRWTPWSSPNAALLGWALAEQRATEPALQTYADALRLAPGDAVLWTEYAQVLGRLGRFDATLSQAVTRAQQLAPHSPAVRRALAELALAYWSRSDESLRALWLDTMRAELARDRGAFLGTVLTRGQGVTFCREPGPALGETAWCERIAPALLGGCYTLAATEPVPCSAP
jgi:tetratricopeptide (TPR) repeat protein